MSKRVVVGALMGALALVTTGCDDECVDQFDCLNEKGSPSSGKVWTCVDNTCEERDAEAPDGGNGPNADPDGGVELDAGTDAGIPDAGTDAGIPDAGVPDAGAPDAGMSVGQGGACTSSPECMPGLRCEGAAGASTTCEPLLVAFSLAGSGSNTSAVAVPFNNTDAAAVLSLSSASRSAQPRWSPDGTQVAFVESVSGGGTQLVTLTVPPAAATRNVLTDSSDAGTDTFKYLEWEPSSLLAWSRKAGSAYSGISVIPGAGGSVVSATPSGVMPSWAADGGTFVYAFGDPRFAGAGIYVGGVTLGASTPIPGAEAGTEPYHNLSNNLVLFLKPDLSRPDGFNTELLVIPESGGTANPVASFGAGEPVTVGGKSGEIRSYIAYPNWSPDGTWAAFARAYYSVELTGTDGGTKTPVLCQNAASLCPDRSPTNIFLQRINPATGAAEGSPVLLVDGATLPSFSPDGRFVAYVKGKRLYVQQIDPAGGTAVGAAIVHSGTTDVLTSEGDDHRPRWQPR
ncbi:hypothetical protein P2318_08875 [Myxococcaceae bacterium GXIMD 01537]